MMKKLEEKTISCVIPTYNRCPYNDRIELNPLLWATASLERQFNIEEIIFVDDGSEDFTEYTIKKISEKSNIKIKYVKNDERQGSGISRNEGVELAKKSKIWFMDDDCVIVGKRILKDLEYSFDFLGEKVGALTLPVGGNSLSSPIAPIHEIGRVDRNKGVMLGCYTKFPEEYLQNLDEVIIDKDRKIFKPLEVELMGGVMLISKEAFKKAGGFPKTPWRNACAEEPHLVLNMQREGYKVFYLPSLDPKFRVFHCRYGDPLFNRIPYDMNVNGASFNDILKESSNKRQNTGNRVSREDELYSNVLSDMCFMFKFFGEKVGLNNLKTKYQVLTERKIFPEVEGRLYIFRKAVKDGLSIVEDEEGLSEKIKNYISSEYEIKEKILIEK